MLAELAPILAGLRDSQRGLWSCGPELMTHGGRQELKKSRKLWLPVLGRSFTSLVLLSFVILGCPKCDLRIGNSVASRDCFQSEGAGTAAIIESKKYGINR